MPAFLSTRWCQFPGLVGVRTYTSGSLRSPPIIGGVLRRFPYEIRFDANHHSRCRAIGCVLRDGHRRCGCLGKRAFAEIPTPVGTLAIGSEKTVPLFGQGSAEPAANRTAILEFIVDDVDAEYERLRGRLAEVVTAPTTMPWGNRALLFGIPTGISSICSRRSRSRRAPSSGYDLPSILHIRHHRHHPGLTVIDVVAVGKPLPGVVGVEVHLDGLHGCDEDGVLAGTERPFAVAHGEGMPV